MITIYVLVCIAWFIAFIWFLALLTSINNSIDRIADELKKLRELEERRLC